MQELVQVDVAQAHGHTCGRLYCISGATTLFQFKVLSNLGLIVDLFIFI